MALFFLLAASFAAQAREYVAVKIVDAYIDLHTGPGRGYPIFHVVDRHESVTVVKRKTDWFKVKTPAGLMGWVSLEQMQNTFTSPEVKAQFGHLAFKHFADRATEFGVMAGNFEGATTMTVRTGYSFSPNLGVDISLAQAAGQVTQSSIISFGLESTPFPKWEFSPFFTLGVGYMKTKPRRNIALVKETSDNLVNAGIGLRYYMTKRLLLTAVVKQHVVFVDHETSGEFLEWKGGISVFY